MTTDTAITSRQKNQAEFWNKESSHMGYCRLFAETAESSKWVSMLLTIEKKQRITIHGSVLEIGGGSQYLSRWIAKNRDCNVICTDIAEDRISDFNEYYDEKMANFQTRGGVNAQRLPFENNTFDFIIGDAVLHHIEDLRSALFEINRCLKPDGQAIFIREPVIGLSTFIKRTIRTMLCALSGNYSSKVNSSRRAYVIGLSRWEYEKTMHQWHEEFFRSGFTVKVSQGWTNFKWADLLKSRFPYLLTTFVSFYLTKYCSCSESIDESDR